jgi:hypothetical protein
MKRAPRDKFSPLPVNPSERRSPIRRVVVGPQDRAGSETGAPIARFMAGGQVTQEQGTSHESETGWGQLQNLSLSAARRGYIVLHVRAGQRRAVAMPANFRNAYATLRFGDGPAGRPYQVLTPALPMNPSERRSPIRRVGVGAQDRAGSETGAPIARDPILHPPSSSVGLRRAPTSEGLIMFIFLVTFTPFCF